MKRKHKSQTKLQRIWSKLSWLIYFRLQPAHYDKELEEIFSSTTKARIELRNEFNQAAIESALEDYKAYKEKLKQAENEKA